LDQLGYGSEMKTKLRSEVLVIVVITSLMMESIRVVGNDTHCDSGD